MEGWCDARVKDGGEVGGLSCNPERFGTTFFFLCLLGRGFLEAARWWRELISRLAIEELAPLVVFFSSCCLLLAAFSSCFLLFALCHSIHHLGCGGEGCGPWPAMARRPFAGVALSGLQICSTGWLKRKRRGDGRREETGARTCRVREG